jgi:hypothetical protein
MKLKLVTAILMTMAAIAWLGSALMVPSGAGSTTRWLIVAAFGGLAIFYWVTYFRMKNSTSGTE